MQLKLWRVHSRIGTGSGTDVKGVARVIYGNSSGGVMKPKLGILVAGLAFAMAALPILAHHSFTAEHDNTKPVTIKGKLVKMDWVNPHSWVHGAVTTPDGKTEQ